MIRAAVLVLTLALPSLCVSSALAQDEARIRRVEQGLAPKMLVVGGPTHSLEARMRHHRVPGLVIAVIDGFDIAWARAYGLADVETGASVTTETLFPAGEISRLPTALAVLKLAEQGKLSLDGKIAPVLRGFTLPDELERGPVVTWRSLISRQASIIGGHGRGGFPPWLEPSSSAALMEQILQHRRAAPTSTVPTIYGLQTIILERALSDLAGQPFPELVRSVVLGPAAMAASVYEQPLRVDRRAIAAAGHNGRGDPIPGKRWVYPDVAGQGLWTTATDLARLAVQYQRALRGDANTLIPQPAAAAAAKEVFDLAEPPGHDTGSGDYLHISGHMEGFSAGLVFHKELGCGAVVMVNSTLVDSLMGEILRAIAREYGWPNFLKSALTTAALSPARLATLTGRYHLDESRVAKLELNADERLMWTDGYNPEPVMLLPLTETRFAIPDFGDEIEFLLGADGEPRAFRTFGIGGKEVVWNRVPAGQSLPIELLEAGEIDRALELLQSRDDPQMLMELGQGLLERRHFAAAATIFRLGTQRLADPARGYEKLAQAALAAGDVRQAALAIVKAFELLPQDPQQDPERAGHVFEMAAELLQTIAQPDPAIPEAIEFARMRRLMHGMIRYTVENGLLDKLGS